MPLEDLLTVAQVARKLGVSRPVVYALCFSGRLPHVRVLNSIRVEPGALVSFVEGSKAQQH
ncbi:MAG: helix-turn-helix domain-containing protein [Deltaproteobacteria bacterium]|nr:helix-turn-helix domain-containing protein [Deltaproteobacteria bacterium]